MSPVSSRYKLPCIYTFCICVCLSKQSTGERHGMWNSKEPNQTSVNILPYFCIFHCSCVIFCSGVFSLYLCVCSSSREGEDKGGGIQGKQTRTVSTFLGFHITNQINHAIMIIDQAFTYYAGKMMTGGGHCGCSRY